MAQQGAQPRTWWSGDVSLEPRIEDDGGVTMWNLGGQWDRPVPALLADLRNVRDHRLGEGSGVSLG